MSDEPTPAPPDRDAEPDRDRELAAALAVDELDDTTRRRLVRRALDEADAGTVDDDETADRRSGRLVAALGLAAALVIGAVVGTVVVTQPEDPSTETAVRAPATTAGGADAKATAPDAAGATDSSAAEAPASVAPPVDLGELGSVPNADGIRIAVNRRLEAGTSSTPASVVCLPSSGGAGVLGLVSITAAGTAVLDGTPVVVLVGPSPAGDSVAAILDAARGCEFIRFVHL